MDFMNEKVPAGSVVANGLNEDPNGIPVLSQEKAGTTFDQRDMARVGKTQELRNLKHTSSGWLCVLGWQSSLASGSYLMATQIQSLLILNDSNYVFERWHGTLLVVAAASIAILFNTLFAKQLPLVERVMLLFHICGFFAVLIPLWVLAPKTSAKVVFTEFQNNGGWSSMGLSALIGMTGPVFALIGPDSAVHMCKRILSPFLQSTDLIPAEETRDASRVLPLGMMSTLILNGLTGWIMVITFCFCIGNIEDAVNSPTGQPYIQVFYNATNSHAGATVMSAIIVFMTLCAIITNLATVSRQTFAFARDFHDSRVARFLSHVNPRYNIPLNAVYLSFILNCLISLLNIGSSVAFNAVASLATAALLSSYIISISCVTLKRWRGEPFPSKRWSLGKWGATLNVVAVLYLCVACFFSFWPLYKEVTAETFNWSIVIYSAVIWYAVSYFYVKGRRQYDGPVVHVNKDI
ncbi:hypothetical protein OEA41_000761 [Lepraria neglecta]|uniref:Amino acid transporter n=1 Tax=Lepraria neglecta TaxID=209136 RepID=A0AAD9ZGU6_9LECA|nr:hypothetical protein OEA41_000761 [Lepraria neglecta]